MMHIVRTALVDASFLIHVEPRTVGQGNMLCGPVSMGAGISGWNSVIANMEKWTGDELIDDADKDLRVIC